MTRIPIDEVAQIVAAWPKPFGYGPYIAIRYSISPRTASVWVHKARKAGLLPPASEGHPCTHCDGTGRRAYRT